jgi:predicted TIM-barrel fold metal-dependent hydrolase
MDEIEETMGQEYLPQRKEIRRPFTPVPPHAVDCHAHIFGPADRFPFAEGRSYTPPEASEADYLAMLATLGIERMVIVQPSVYGFDNRCTMEAVGRFGLDRARAIVHVHGDDRPQDLARLREGGARGVRFITMSKGGTSLDDLRAVARLCADQGWHLQMYLPPRTWAELTRTLRDLPVPVVIDHMGQAMPSAPDFEASSRTILTLLERPDTWIKLCGYRVSAGGPPYADVAPWARRLIEAAPERCVWGTDWPHPNMEGHMPDDGELIDLLAAWCPDEARRRAILVDNPARLYGF